jgi:hypothetical protein
MTCGSNHLVAANRRSRFPFGARYRFDVWVCACRLLIAPVADRDRWAVRLRESGLLYEKVQQTTVYEQLRGTHRGKKSPISMGVATSVYFRPACAQLYALIEQALPANLQAH